MNRTTATRAKEVSRKRITMPRCNLSDLAAAEGEIITLV